MLALGGCSTASVELAHLEEQGEAGRVALALMEAHGGLARFIALGDLEYAVAVERYDADGALSDVGRELHRFQTAAPRRYLLRRTGGRVMELGLVDREGWLRLDGVLEENPQATELSVQELAFRAVLNRAPFSLADPGLVLSLPSGSAPSTDEGGLRRLAVEIPGGERERYVFGIDPATGRVAEIIFENPNPAATHPLRVARVERVAEHEGVAVITSWSVTSADRTGIPQGVPDTRWMVEEIRSGNGFTDRLYRPSGS
jgi:hypothetical protein